MIEQAIQFAILFISGAAIAMLNSRLRRIRFAGAIVGLCGQPLWFYTTIVHRQWGIFALTVWYSVAYWKGICNNSGDCD